VLAARVVLVVAALVAGCARGAAPEATGPARPSSARSVAARVPPPAPRELEGVRVAVTFDDLGVDAASVEPARSRRILAALDAAGAPAAVFANCTAITAEALAAWKSAGAAIGNHTATHRDLDAKDALGAGVGAAWWQDVESCHERLSALLGEPVRYFRYPYLRYGKDEATKREAARRLASLGYAIGHVTAATAEWLIAQYYETAVSRHDAALASDLVAAYVEHMVLTLRAARDLAVAKLGHDVPQITLLHVNRLAAEHVADVFSALRARGVRFVSLPEALADPVYSLPDAYTGGCGCSWLARIAPPLTRDEPYVFGDYEEALRKRFASRVTPP
jgi:peptidoglycan/xylan/chitin deacetylase (PgdA/CDA1 family)